MTVARMVVYLNSDASIGLFAFVSTLFVFYQWTKAACAAGIATSRCRGFAALRCEDFLIGLRLKQREIGHKT
jgi:hypothetical protein